MTPEDTEPPARRGLDVVRIDHVVLRVVDVEASLRFYCDVLGCVEERRVDRLGLTQLRAGDSLIDLVDVAGELGRAGGAPPGASGRNVDHLALRIAKPPEAIEAHLRAHKIEYSPFERRYGGEGFALSTYLRDPDGNVVELRGAPIQE